MSDTVKLSGMNFFKSWSCCVPGFENALARLRGGKLVEDATHKHIYEASGKYVWRCQDDGFDFAYKTQDGKKPWRYMFRASLPVREVKHYAILAALGIPIPDVYAVGDTRKFFILKESFLVTGFLENTVDGRIFMRGGEYRDGREELKREFCCRHLTLLAKLHDAGYYHKASHPRNFLFRGETPENMEVFWIDVARLRRARDIRRAVVVDLHTFFRDMCLKKADLLRLLEFYSSRVENKIFSRDEIFDQLVNFKRRMFSKKKYRLFEE